MTTALKTNRSLWKYIGLSIVTFGIYGIVCFTKISKEINLIAKDQKKTTNYCLMYFVFSVLTLGIAWLVWHHRISNKMAAELEKRGLSYNFSSKTFWGWGVFGSLLFGVGPFIFLHRFFKAMNMLAADYNAKGE